MTGDNAPPPGGAAPLRVIGFAVACTSSSQTVYIVTVSSSCCAASHTSVLAPVGLHRPPAPGMLEAVNDIPTHPT